MSEGVGGLWTREELGRRGWRRVEIRFLLGPADGPVEREDGGPAREGWRWERVIEAEEYRDHLREEREDRLQDWEAGQADFPDDRALLRRATGQEETMSGGRAAADAEALERAAEAERVGSARALLDELQSQREGEG